MISSYICRACRQKINQIRLEKALQWLPKRNKATFISLSSDPQNPKNRKSSKHISNVGHDAGKKRQGNPREGSERKKRPFQSRTADARHDELESMFEEILTEPSTSRLKHSKSSKSLDLYKHAETLKNMVADQKCSPEIAWRFFLEHFGPDAWKNGSITKASSPSHLYARRTGTTDYKRECIGRALLMKIADWSSQSHSSSTTYPTFTEVSRVYLQLGILHGSEWSKMMISLIGNILKCKESLPDPAYNARLLLDLVGSWNIVFRQIGKPFNDHPPNSGVAFDWSNAPVIRQWHLVGAFQKRGPKGAFEFLIPTLQAHQTVDISLISVATFALLTEPSITGEPVVENAMPLTSSLAQIISLPTFEMDKLRVSSYDGSALLLDYIHSHWLAIKTRSSEIHNTSASLSPFSKLVSSPTKDTSLLYKKMKFAVSGQDSNQLDKLFAEVMTYPIYTEPTAQGGRPKPQPAGTLSAKTCNYFIEAYMTLRRPNSAISVWNFMVKNGFQPDSSTWNHMLLGCRQARDPQALEDIWGRMLALRIQPDVVLWTTRIGGLIDCNKYEQGLRALDEMGRTWLTAARQEHANKRSKAKEVQRGSQQNSRGLEQEPSKIDLASLRNVGDVEGVVKPTTATINAAIHGLLRSHQNDIAYQVLSWASKYGIPPDLTTYNTLLRSLVRSGQKGQAAKLLQQMADNDINADVVTFTTILEEAFRDSDNQTPEELQKIIFGVFSAMESCGIEANAHTYSRIIYQLLLNDKADLSPVNAVLARMSQQGLSPTPHIYTMLLEYYFSRDPPDRDAVRHLVERAQSEIGSTDLVFWDRVIQGYALVGDTASAMRIMGRLEGKRIGWVTLQNVITTLVSKDEWDVAKTLVRNMILDTGGPLADDIAGQDGQHGFWRLAAQLKLIEA